MNGYYVVHQNGLHWMLDRKTGERYYLPHDAYLWILNK